MSMSLRFKNATNHLFRIITAMTSNQNALRLIKYGDGDPLSKDRKDVDSDLMYEYIFPVFPDINTMPDNEKIMVFVNPDESGFYNGVSTTIEDIYKTDIIVPAGYSFTDSGELRAFKIAYELIKDIDNKNISGVGKAEVFKYKYYKLGDNHVALTFYTEIMTPKKTI